MITLFVIIGLLLLSNVYFIRFFFMTKTLKKGLKEYQNLGTGRYGFYRRSDSYRATSYDSIIYVKEIDRYSNGYSRIIIDSIEPYQSNDRDASINNAIREFVTLKLTSEIQWLEGEDHLRKLRKQKLEELKKI